MENQYSLVNEIVIAHQRIAPHVRQTYLQHSPYLSELSGANVYLKCENLQHTGSFKLRGAANKYLSLTDVEQQRGVVAASTGNHGKAVAYVVKRFGGTAEIFAPENADPVKLDSIRQLGGQVRFAGNDCVAAEQAARVHATQNSMTYISPYNDSLVIAGQGTIGVEICDQLDPIDAVFASVGGGGLICGIAAFVRSRFPDCEIIGGSPENSKVMFDSMAAGRLLESPSTETLSDGTAGGVEQDSITFGLCQHFIDHWETVSESAIAECLIEFTQQHSMLIEGAAAVAIAGLLQTGRRLAGKNVVVILCGGNIGWKRLAEVAGGRV